MKIFRKKHKIILVVKRSALSKSRIVFLPPLADGDMKRRQPDNSKMQKVLDRSLTSLKKPQSLIYKQGAVEGWVLK